MIVVIFVHNAISRNKYYLIDQTNHLSKGWCNTIEECLNGLRREALADAYFTSSLDWYYERFPDFECFYLDATEPYEFW